MLKFVCNVYSLFQESILHPSEDQLKLLGQLVASEEDVSSLSPSTMNKLIASLTENTSGDISFPSLQRDAEEAVEEDKADSEGGAIAETDIGLEEEKTSDKGSGEESETGEADGDEEGGDKDEAGGEDEGDAAGGDNGDNEEAEEEAEPNETDETPASGNEAAEGV